MKMKHFTIDELVTSPTAARCKIANIPSPNTISNLQRLVAITLDPAREKLGIPIKVNSGYRSPELNKKVGGATKSFHLQGRAADLTTGSRTGNLKLYTILQSLPHTELINEKDATWIHVAL